MHVTDTIDHSTYPGHEQGFEGRPRGIVGLAALIFLAGGSLLHFWSDRIP